MTRSLGARSRRFAAVALFACASVLLAACASPRNALGPTESGCYQTLPVARAVAGHSARFAGVRYLSASEIERAINAGKSSLVDLISLPQNERSASCVVAFHGRFSGSVDEHSFGPSSGAFLIVVVSLASDHVLAALVLHHPPFRLARFLPTTH